MIFETVVSTLSPAGELHLAPMGATRARARPPASS